MFLSDRFLHCKAHFLFLLFSLLPFKGSFLGGSKFFLVNSRLVNALPLGVVRTIFNHLFNDGFVSNISSYACINRVVFYFVRHEFDLDML